MATGAGTHGAAAAAQGGQAAHGAQAAGAEFDPAGTILHHILDSHEIEIPFTGRSIELPRLELFGIDVSITRNVVMMWIAAAILLLLFWIASRQARRPQEAPRGLRGMLEPIILYIRDEIVRKSMGKEGDAYLPFFLTVFFFILACALLGLVPGFGTPTSAIGVTAALAGIVLVLTQWAGIRHHGVVGHFRNLVPHGLPAWLLPIMIPVELLGVFARPFALAIRLFANMMAGHVVIISLISLIFIMETLLVAPVSVAFTLFIFVLELMVAFIQAYIFTMLAALFIGMSVHPAH